MCTVSQGHGYVARDHGAVSGHAILPNHRGSNDLSVQLQLDPNHLIHLLGPYGASQNKTRRRIRRRLKFDGKRQGAFGLIEERQDAQAAAVNLVNYWNSR